jgi:hypothetical protein
MEGREGRGVREWNRKETEPNRKRRNTHPFMTFQHSLTRSRIHIPHTNSLVIRAWHDPTTIRQGTDTHDPLIKNQRKRRERSEGMKQKGDRTKEEEEEEEEEWEITHISMAFQHSLTRSRIHIPHTNSVVFRSWHDPTTIRQGTDTRDHLTKKRREWGDETERRQNQRGGAREGRSMEDHSHLHDLPTLAHKIPYPDSTHEQSCQKILTRPDDHQARHRHSRPPNEEEKRVREWNRKETESKRRRKRRKGKNGRSLTSPWPSNTRSQDPVSTSHTRTVLSTEPDTTRRPSGKAQTHLTL